MAIFNNTTGTVIGTAGVDTLVSDYSLLTATYPFGIHLNSGGGQNIRDRFGGNIILHHFLIEQFNVTGTNGKDALEGGNYADIFYGRDGNDYLDGKGGNDILYGDFGNDTLVGGDGDDTLDGGSGNDTLDGGTGVDTLVADYSSLTTTYPFGIHLNSGGGQNIRDRGPGTVILTYSNIEQFNVTGTNGKDALEGGNYNDSFYGSYGNDYLVGNGGNDTLDGGDGNDTLDGGNGADTLAGGLGDDILYGGAGDTLTDLNGNNQFYANEGTVTGIGTLYMDYRGWGYGISTDGTEGSGHVSELRSISETPIILNVIFYSGVLVVNLQGSEHDDSISNLTYQNSVFYGNGGNDYIDGSYGEQQIYGGTGNDTLDGGYGNDVINGDTGNDTLVGGEGNDVLNGGIGDDILDGGQGADTVNGGGGDDTIYSVTGVSGIARHLYGGAGKDTFMLDVSGDININYNFKFNTQALAQFINEITLPDASGKDWGHVAKDITYDAASTFLGAIPGIGPAFSFLAGLEKTGYDLETERQTLLAQIETQKNKAIEVANSSHYNSLNWGDLSTTTIGQRDTVIIDDFQIGNDIIMLPKIEINPDPTKATYSYSTRFAYFPGSNDKGVFIAVHQKGGGFAEQTKDIVFIKNNYKAAGIDDAEFEATIQKLLVNGQIGRFSDTPVIGTTGNDILGLDSDVSFANDMIYAGEGNDSVYGFYGDDVIEGQGGNDIIFGGTGNDQNYVPFFKDIYETDGNDYISGGDGDDKLYGEMGDDYLNGDSTNGKNGAEKVFVGTGNDSLYGGAGDDILEGGNGNDVLNGGTGIDKMRGGTGNDNYAVDIIGDIVDETNGGGIDTVNSSITYTLGASIENLNLSPTIGSTAINGVGNILNNIINGNNGNNVLSGLAGNDTLNGNGGNDVLNGGAGIDQMKGGAGNDSYIVDNIGDIVDETNGGGIDTVNSFITYTLGTSIENLNLSPTIGSTAINGVGNTLNNIINGNNGNNVLSGLVGNDTLNGNGGNDSLQGGLGNDALNGGAGIDNFLFNTALGAGNVDTITGYSVADDTIRLENAIFTSVGAAGALNATMFKAGGIQDANDFILYNTATGALSYDADANGAGAAVQFATLVGVPPLTAADFIVV